MKKISFLLGVIACTVVLAACGVHEETTPNEETTQNEEITQNEETAPKEETSETDGTEQNVTEEEDANATEENQNDAAEEGKVYIADAAMYRGTVNHIAEDTEGTIVELEQAEGTDFGAAKLRFLWNEDTKISFEKEALEVGSYLEVFYGSAPGQTLDENEVLPIIGANIYMSAEMVNFNGVIQEVQPGKTKGEGSLFMKDSLNGQDVIFHYDTEHTQIYAEITDLKKGDQLNIFHRGIYTMSLPPQGSALEIRLIPEA